MKCEDLPVFALGIELRRAQMACTAVLRPLGVTPQQLCVLIALAESDGRNPKELAARVHIRPATLTGLLSRLERAGLIARGPDLRDGRAHRIYLTEQSRTRLTEAEAALRTLTIARSDSPAAADTPNIAVSEPGILSARAG